MVVMLPVAFIASKEPPRYRATAVVLLEARPDRGVPVFQDMSPNRPFPVQMAILASRSLAETVVENLPKASLQELLETSYQTNFLGSLVSAYQGWRGIEPPAPNPKRRALAELQRARVIVPALARQERHHHHLGGGVASDGLRRHRQHLHRSAHVPNAHLQHR